MRASVLAYNLTEIVIRPNSTTTSDENSNSNNTSSGPNSNPNSNTNKKQLWPATSDKERDVAVTALVICDILGKALNSNPTSNANPHSTTKPNSNPTQPLP
jgi:hypothetical protein